MPCSTWVAETKIKAKFRLTHKNNFLYPLCNFRVNCREWLKIMKFLPYSAGIVSSDVYCRSGRYRSEPRNYFVRNFGWLSGIGISHSDPFFVILENCVPCTDRDAISDDNSAFIPIDDRHGVSFRLMPADLNATAELQVSPCSFVSGTIEEFSPEKFEINGGKGIWGGIVTPALAARLGRFYETFINKPYVVIMAWDEEITILTVDNYGKWYRQSSDNTDYFIGSAKVVAAVRPEVISQLARSILRNRFVTKDQLTFYIKPQLNNHKVAGVKGRCLISRMVEEITGKTGLNEVGDTAIAYYRYLPGLICKSFPEERLNTNFLKDQLKKSSFTLSTLRNIFDSVAYWSEDSQQIAMTFLGDTLPKLLAITSMRKSDNRAEHLAFGFSRLARQIGRKYVNILSPLCPSYCYLMDSRNNLIHASGNLLPKVGSRFETVAHTLGKIFLPLTTEGVTINWEFWAYSGETGDTDHLVDVGQFIIDYYKGDLYRLFISLGKSYKDLDGKARIIFNRYGIHAKAVSIDGTIGNTVNDLVDDFIKSFPDQLDEITCENQVEEWMEVIIGSRTLLYYFIEEEKKYRRKQWGIGIECADPLIPAALREALLYFLLLNHLLKNNLLIINTESTSNYMSGALRHLHAPVITGKAFDPLYQERSYTLNIRQPYNLPANMAGDTDSGMTYKKFEKIDSANKSKERVASNPFP